MSILNPAEMPLASMLPNTQFFEVSSRAANARFGVWVTTPPAYDPAGQDRFPAIFMPDGNLFAPLAIPFVALLSTGEMIFPIKPYIQVTIGYCGAEADLMAAVRARDLLPPGEPSPPMVLQGLQAMADMGGPKADLSKLYLANLLNPKADAFLAFLTEELYPEIARRWRIDPATSGLFGDSYGGLFAVWVALQRVAQFPIVGAGSPGIVTAESKVFVRLNEEVAANADHTGRHLHLSICEPEISQLGFYQQLAEPYARLLRLLGVQPLKGLKVTTHTIPFESHLTGAMSNFFSFLRACYSVTKV